MSRYNPSFFDATYYLQQNADVAANWTGPVEDHFFFHGAAEGRMPAPWFDAQYVRATYPDLAELNAEQLFAHYNQFGYNEGRVTAARFEGFDAARYLAENADLEPGGITLTSALMHFMVFGEGEGRTAYTTSGDPIVPPGSVGLTLTVGVDTLVGAGGNDVFLAPLGNDLSLNVVNTLSDFDDLDGAAGVDVLRAQLVDDVDGLKMASVENVFLSARDNSWIEVDFANVTGVEQLWNADSDADSELYVYDVQAPAIIGMSNVGADAWYEVDYADGVEVAEQTVVLDRVGTMDDHAWLGVYTDDDIDTLNVVASGGVFLEVDGELEYVANLNIAGSGALALMGDDVDFPNLVTLDSTGYEGNLDIDVSDSAVLESVVTGAGDDRVVIAAAHFSENVNVLQTVDLGAGSNTLALRDTVGVAPFGGNGSFDSAEIEALDFELATNANVSTLEFADYIGLTADATLTLAGLDGVTTLAFEDFDALGFNFEIAGAGAALLITVDDGDFDMNGVLTIDGVVDLTVESTYDDVWLTGGLNANALETLTVLAEDDAELYIDLTAGSSVDSLREITMVADYWADVYLYGDTVAEEGFESLESIAVESRYDAYVDLDGVYGAFTLAVTSLEEDVDAYVYNAGVTDITLAAAGDAYLYLLETPDLQSIDISSVADYAYVDAAGAAFEGVATVSIGASAEVDYYADTATSSREVFQFVGDDIGAIEIFDFEAGVGANRDRLDFSQFDGVSSTEDLVIVDDGFGNSVITAADGQFDGSITLAGVLPDAELGASFIF